MYFNESLSFIPEFIKGVNDNLIEGGHPSLSQKQAKWLSFSMMGILSSRTLCWKENERNSLGKYSDGAQSWMFRHSSIPWENLFEAGIRNTLREFNITKGSLLVDETDRGRSKSTKDIYQVHYLKDKKKRRNNCRAMYCYIIFNHSKYQYPCWI